MVSKISSLENSLDKVAYIPLISSIASIVHLVAKACLKNMTCESYKEYLTKRSFSEIALDAIPFYRFFQPRSKENLALEKGHKTEEVKVDLIAQARAVSKSDEPHAVGALEVHESEWSLKAQELFKKMKKNVEPKFLDEDHEEVRELCANPKFRLEVIKRCGIDSAMGYFFPGEEDKCDDLDFMLEAVKIGNSGILIDSYAAESVKKNPDFRIACVKKDGFNLFKLDLKFDDNPETIELVAQSIHQNLSVIFRKPLIDTYKDNGSLAIRLFQLRKGKDLGDFNGPYTGVFTAGVTWDMQKFLGIPTSYKDRPKG